MSPLRKDLGTRSILFVLAVVGFIVLAIVVSCGPARAHDWYDFSCCNKADCYQTKLGEVERHDGGWFIVTTGELIPFDSKLIKASQDPLIHRCYIKTYVDQRLQFRDKSPTRCLYVPEMGG